MKNLKIISAILPVFLLVSVIYFSTSGFSGSKQKEIPEFKKEVAENNASENPSDLCIFSIHIASANPNCLSGSYTFCINGATVDYVTGEDFEIKLECGSTYSLCVHSSTGCHGSITINVPCPCRSYNPRTVTIGTGPEDCACTND